MSKYIYFSVLLLWYVSSSEACQTRVKSPVLELRPLPKDQEDTLIWASASNSSSTQYWVDQIDSFLKPCSRGSETWMVCPINESPRKGLVCEAPNMKHLIDPCIPQHNYGYDRATPCIFLTFTQVPQQWSPFYYDSASLPAKMPEDLKVMVRENEPLQTHQRVWVSCEGETASDRENIGPILYFPSRGVPVNRFLNTEVKGYLDPLVAVVFKGPARGVVIMVQCTAWAKNIPRNPEDKMGSVRFELLVE